MKRRLILGTDFWEDCDDAVAIRLLSRAIKRGEIDLLAIVVNTEMECTAAAVDGLLQSDGVSGVPIGVAHGISDFAGVHGYHAHLAQYAVDYKSNAQALDAVKMYRKALALADAPVEMMEIGFLHALVELLESGPDEYSDKTGMELVREKVKQMWIMAGKWDVDNGWEYNFAFTARTRTAAHKLCEICPVPITFLGFEVGVDVISGGTLKEGDPLRDVLIDHGSPNGRCSWDPMLVQLALTGDIERAGYRAVRGTASVDEVGGGNHFVPTEDGQHCYVVKVKDNDYYKDTINAIIA